MTPEEQAVIDAAKDWFWTKVKHNTIIRASPLGTEDSELNRMALEMSDGELALQKAVARLIDTEKAEARK